MIDHDDAPSICFPPPPELFKVDRSTMAQLVVEAEHCSQVLGRVLEVIRKREILLFTIATRRDTRVQVIELELTALTQRPALAVLQDLRRLSNVRVARFLYPCDQLSRPAISAKA